MIHVTVLYPNQEGARFDATYYLETHTPMIFKLLGNSCKSVKIEKGLAGPFPGTAPTYLYIAQLEFESLDVFQAAFAAHGQALMGDIPNYTDIQPVIQISEVVC